MQTEAMQRIIETILKYSYSEQDALEIVAALGEVPWKNLIYRSIECEECGYVWMVCKKPTTWICPRCDPHKLREHEKLLYAQQHEPKSASTLSIDIWIKILDYFNWKCAYCRKRHYEELDHYIPRSLKGLTTVDNCVPSCKKCNVKKHNYLPDDIKFLPREDIERVGNFLNSL